MTFFFNQVHLELSTHVSTPEEATREGYRSSIIKRTPVKGYSLIGLLSRSEVLVNRMRVRLINISHFWPKPKDERQKGLSTVKYPVPIVAYSLRSSHRKCRSGESRLSGSHSMNFMFLVGLPFRGTFQFSFTVLVHYRFTTEYLALDRRHDPYSVSTLKLTYSQTSLISF
jgi:hypothetical protein